VTRREEPRDGRIDRRRRMSPAALTRPARAGQRVFLRPLAASDREEVLRLARASQTLHRPWVESPTNRAAFRSFLRRSRLPSVRTLVAVRRDDHAIVGVLTLSQIFRGSFRSAYLGYWVGAPHAGQGYMTEAMQLLLRRAFGPLKLHRVEANLQPGNAASRALVLRSGFRKEGFSPRYLEIGGRWRDHERWAITVEDFLGREPGSSRRGSSARAEARRSPGGVARSTTRRLRARSRRRRRPRRSTSGCS